MCQFSKWRANSTIFVALRLNSNQCGYIPCGLSHPCEYNSWIPPPYRSGQVVDCMKTLGANLSLIPAAIWSTQCIIIIKLFRIALRWYLLMFLKIYLEIKRFPVKWRCNAPTAGRVITVSVRKCFSCSDIILYCRSSECSEFSRLVTGRTNRILEYSILFSQS